jgi:hypothetical protein
MFTLDYMSTRMNPRKLTGSGLLICQRSFRKAIISHDIFVFIGSSRSQYVRNSVLLRLPTLHRANEPFFLATTEHFRIIPPFTLRA